VFRLINLRHEFEHPQIMRRFELVSEAVDEVVADVETVEAAGDGPLAQLLDLAIYGDFTSLYLAGQEGIDPGPVPVLEDMKRALAAE
jgi:glucose/mannose-6-phosphate isomerase